MEREPQPQNVPARVSDPFSVKGISRPAVQLFSIGNVVQLSKFLEEKTGKKKGVYTRKDVLKYLFKESDPELQDQAIYDWNKEHSARKERIDPDILIPTDTYRDPENEFMPPMWNKGTKTNWSTQEFDPDGGDEPTFYTSKNIGTAVRAHLKQIEKSSGREHTDIKGQAEYACNSCLKPTSNDALQTDHAHAASDILARQQKIIARMNKDPEYKVAVMKYLPDADLYFVGDAPDIVGSKLFFNRFYNHMDNLWFLCSTCNGLTGKSGDDLLDWLEGQDWFGKAFIASLGKVRDKGILMRAEDGTTVAQKAIEWAVLHGKLEYDSKSLIKDVGTGFGEDLRKLTILGVKEEHSGSAKERKAAQSEAAKERPVMEGRLGIVSKSRRFSLGTIGVVNSAIERREQEKHPAFQDGKVNPEKPNTFQPNTPNRSHSHYKLGQEAAKEEEAIKEYPSLLRKKTDLLEELKEKDEEIQKLRERSEQDAKEKAEMRAEIERLRQQVTIPSLAVTTTTTVSRKANISKGDIIAIVEIHPPVAKALTLGKLRTLFTNKSIDQKAWEAMTITAQNTVIAGVLLKENLIKEPKIVGIYGNAAEWANSFTDAAAYII